MVLENLADAAALPVDDDNSVASMCDAFEAAQLNNLEHLGGSQHDQVDKRTALEAQLKTVQERLEGSDSQEAPTRISNTEANMTESSTRSDLQQTQIELSDERIALELQLKMLQKERLERAEILEPNRSRRLPAISEEERRNPLKAIRNSTVRFRMMQQKLFNSPLENNVPTNLENSRRNPRGRAPRR